MALTWPGRTSDERTALSRFSTSKGPLTEHCGWLLLSLCALRLFSENFLLLCRLLAPCRSAPTVNCFPSESRVILCKLTRPHFWTAKPGHYLWLSHPFHGWMLAASDELLPAQHRGRGSAQSILTPEAGLSLRRAFASGTEARTRRGLLYQWGRGVAHPSCCFVTDASESDCGVAGL